MLAPDPYGRTVLHGKSLDNATAAALKVAETILGYELTIIQGIGGAAASAGTHTEGRAADLAPYDQARKVRVLRDVGFAAWYRPTLPGVWGAHIHAVLIFENRENSRGLADSGWRQIGSYLSGRNGLANNAVDGTYRPSPAAVFTRAEYERTFVAPKPKPKRNNVMRARNRISEAQALLSQAAALLADTEETRVVVQAGAVKVDALADEAEALLGVLPPK